MTKHRNGGILESEQRLEVNELTTLRQEREKARLTQAELSQISGVPQAVISDIEKGITKNPRFETVKKLSTALHFNISDLEIAGEAVGQ